MGDYYYAQGAHSIIRFKFRKKVVHKCEVSNCEICVIVFLTRHGRVFVAAIRYSKGVLTLYGPNSFFRRFSGHNLR